MEEKNNKKEISKYGTRIFLFGLEVILYFGIPAILGTIVSNLIEKNHPEKSKGITIGILFFTYILSWMIVFFRFRSIRAKYTKRDKIT